MLDHRPHPSIPLPQFKLLAGVPSIHDQPLFRVPADADCEQPIHHCGYAPFIVGRSVSYNDAYKPLVLLGDPNVIRCDPETQYDCAPL